MKLNKLQISTILLFLLLIPFYSSMESCGTKTAKTDSFVPLYTPEYSKGFRILADTASGNSIIECYAPWQGADSGAVRRLLVLRDGSAVPAGFDGCVLRDSVRRVVVMSSTHVAMLDAVDALDVIAGVSGKDYICNSQVVSSSAADVGYEGAVDYETLTMLNPDIVLLYGVNGPSTMENKLQSLGIPYLYIGDYVEQHPLGKAEWVLAIGEITGRSAIAKAVLDSVVARYEGLQQAVADIAPRPKVMFNNPYGTAWYMPGASSYAVKLVKDAGGDYVYERNEGTSSASIDVEEAYMLASQSDKWLNISGMPILAAFREAYPRFAVLPVVRSGAIYGNDAITSRGGGNDFYESAVMHPDLVLKDLIIILHPELSDDSVLTYYRRIQ